MERGSGGRVEGRVEGGGGWGEGGGMRKDRRKRTINCNTSASIDVPARAVSKVNIGKQNSKISLGIVSY